MIDAASGGGLMDKTPQEARDGVKNGNEWSAVWSKRQSTWSQCNQLASLNNPSLKGLASKESKMRIFSINVSAVSWLELKKTLSLKVLHAEVL